MAIDDDKSELRAFVRLTRLARTDADRAVASDSFDDFLAILADQFSWARIAAFIPTPSEPPIAAGLNNLVSAGVSVIVPVSRPDGLLDWVELGVDAIWSTQKDELTMPVPTVGDRVTAGSLDAVLVPAAAVDRDGNRLGWGKGFYDRFLAQVEGNPLVIAVVFDSDVVVTIPTESHDAPVGAILTETEITFTQ
jgi:5-formyltetrahydrofolate cyclo-ligase